jgi:ribosomal protein S18 acetylase RimI-like enzyme
LLMRDDVPVALPPKSEFSPPFIHQLFDEDVLFGYKEPALRIWVRDPDLALCVTASARSVLQAAVTVRLPTAEGKASLVHAGADDVAERLRVMHVLPRDAPSGSFIAAVGADAPERSLSLHWAPAPSTGKSNGALWAPPGDLVQNYSRGARNFAVFSWIPASAPEYHTRLGALGLYLIENKSAVDAHDEKWSQLSVYEMDGEGHVMATVGFSLVYRFSNPMREIRPDSLRLAQLVILPRFQRDGHGEELLELIYTRACRDEAVFDVGIEDPCEGMSRLRDVVDIGRAWKARVFSSLPGWERWGPGSTSCTNEDASALVVEAPPAALSAARSVLRCTIGQAQRAYLALLYCRLGLTDCSGDGIAKAYRLLVKRAALDADADVRAIKEAERRKAVLEDRFCEMIAAFTTALSRIIDCGHTLVTKETAEKARELWAKRRADAEAASSSAPA